VTEERTIYPHKILHCISGSLSVGQKFNNYEDYSGERENGGWNQRRHPRPPGWDNLNIREADEGFQGVNFEGEWRREEWNRHEERRPEGWRQEGDRFGGGSQEGGGEFGGDGFVGGGGDLFDDEDWLFRRREEHRHHFHHHPLVPPPQPWEAATEPTPTVQVESLSQSTGCRCGVSQSREDLLIPMSCQFKSCQSLTVVFLLVVWEGIIGLLLFFLYWAEQRVNNYVYLCEV